ncbi:hypothetical protein LC048_01730 [Mesobacillus subterraneus]|uniref:hypothetical protein n=1 Tax=Mesobacillus subterraneus TaxID=285983 RepID=UPI001CFDE75B|nr:hypothetical protein [Mesobacillus subterraneus]WLR55756.1 hypothetical protein LC048_01730 [Mesobacillus subterraneus]
MKSFFDFIGRTPVKLFFDFIGRTPVKLFFDFIGRTEATRGARRWSWTILEVKYTFSSHKKKPMFTLNSGYVICFSFSNNTDNLHIRIHNRKAGNRRNRNHMDADTIVRCLKGLRVLLQQKGLQSQNQMGVCHHNMVFFYTSSYLPHIFAYITSYAKSEGVEWAFVHYSRKKA